MKTTRRLVLSAAESVGTNCRALQHALLTYESGTPHITTIGGNGQIGQAVDVVLDITASAHHAARTNASSPTATFEEVLDQVNMLYQTATEISLSAMRENTDNTLASYIDLSVLLRRSVPYPPCDTPAEERDDAWMERPLTACDLSSLVGQSAPNSFEIPLQRLYSHVALGGTFDWLHSGHKVLLTQAALIARTRLRVGITGPILLGNKSQKKHQEHMQSLEVRLANVASFIGKLRGDDLILDIFELETGDGGCESLTDLDAMVCSPETLPAVEQINNTRVAKHLLPVTPIVIKYVGGDTNMARISSSRIRQMIASASQ